MTYERYLTFAGSSKDDSDYFLKDPCQLAESDPIKRSMSLAVKTNRFGMNLPAFTLKVFHGLFVCFKNVNLLNMIA